MARRRKRLLGERQGVPRGDRQLQAHQVEPGHQLGHAVLDLEPGVHLQEVVAVVVDEELHRAHALVPDRGGRSHRRLPHALADLQGHQDGRRLLHHFLVASLHRALSVEQVGDGATAVADHLYLHVARRRQKALQEHLVRTEGGGRLALGRRHRVRQTLARLHQAHAPAATTGGCLDEEWVSDIGRDRGEPRGRRCRWHHDAG